jgi:hypothetical protein
MVEFTNGGMLKMDIQTLFDEHKADEANYRKKLKAYK